MNPEIDLAGMVLRAIAGLPAQAIVAYNQVPDAWNQIGLGMLAPAWRLTESQAGPTQTCTASLNQGSKGEPGTFSVGRWSSLLSS